MALLQNLDCRAWQFGDIPAFTAGKMNPVFADCGKGLFDTDCCFMHTFNEAEEKDVLSYVELLQSTDFALLFKNETAENLFYEFQWKDGLFSLGYLKNDKVLRLILEQGQGVSVSKFGYSDFEKIRDNTVFSQYSLFYDAMIKGTTCDCGMNYVFRLRDNSLVIIDGGEMEQSTDIAVADYMDFLHSLTGTKSGEPMRISLWLCTHAHNDHADFFSKLILRFSKELQVERAAFNFPAAENTSHSPSISVLIERLKKHYPKILFLKLHTGMKFSVANAIFTVFSSAENVVGNETDCLFAGLNDTSVTFSVEVEGRKALFLADMGQRNGDIFKRNFCHDGMNTDFLQAAHHGINSIYDVYEAIDTQYLLLPQCKMNMETRFKEQQDHFETKYGKNKILLANDKTDVFTMENGKVIHSERRQVGSCYDGSEW